MSTAPDDHDNASSISHTTASFSTRPQFKQHPPRQLRRVKTMTQLTRWVTQKVSRHSLKNSTSGNKLSEKNLNDLDMITTVVGDQGDSGPDNSAQEKPALVPGQAKVIETIQEDLEDAGSEKASAPDPEAVKEIRLRRSYAAFCEEFTLSGPQQPKRRFEVSMGIEDPKEKKEIDTVQSVQCLTDTGKVLERPPATALQSSSELPQRQTPTSLRESPKVPDVTTAEHTHSSPITNEAQMEAKNEALKSIDSQVASTSHPQPPPQVLTPSIYQDMQHARQERKRGRREKFWGPLRSLFSRSQSLRGHRVELE